MHVVSLPEVEARLPGPDTAWLTAGEDLRLQAIAAALRRRQYLAGHWLLREMAAEAFGDAPPAWRFETDEDPRPRLRHADGRRLWASLSHSGEQLAAAIAPAPVGLDLERPQQSVLAIANGHISGRKVGSPILGGPEQDKGFAAVTAARSASSLYGNSFTASSTSPTARPAS